MKELEVRASESVLELSETRQKENELRVEVASASDLCQRYEARMDRYQSEVVALTERVQLLDMDIQRKNEELSSLRTVTTRLTTERLAQAADLRKLQASREVWEQRAAELESLRADTVAQLERSRAEVEALNTRIRRLDTTVAAYQAELEGEREALRILRAEHASLKGLVEEQSRMSSMATQMQDAITAQLQREREEVEASKGRASAAEAQCLVERGLRVEAETKISLLGEQLGAYQERCRWLQSKFEEAQKEAQSAVMRERLCEAESTQTALRMGLFQRIVTADAAQQQSTAPIRTLPLRKGMQREQHVRQAALNRLSELGGRTR